MATTEQARIGACGAKPACRYGCTGVTGERSVSGWRTCGCGHTVHVHALVAVEKPQR